MYAKKIFLLLALCTTALMTLVVAPIQASETLASGQWQEIDFAVAGQWKIVQESDGLYVVLDDQFETKNGPDLHILLSPRSVDRLTNSNTAQESLIVGLLVSTDESSFFTKMKGAQRLKIPAGVDLTKYKSIAIHCVRFSHVWAGAHL